MKPDKKFEILRTTHWSIHHCPDVGVPGYVVITSNYKSDDTGDLSRAASEELGLLLTYSTDAIESLIKPERVYICQFGESRTATHFHIFPRMSWMKELMAGGVTTADGVLDGGALFSKARCKFSAPEELRKAEPKMLEVTAAMKEMIGEALGMVESGVWQQ